MEELLKRENELKERLSAIGSKIKRNKTDLQFTYNALYCWKRQAYDLKFSIDHHSDVWKNERKLISLNAEIEWKRESLTEKEDEQRKLIFLFKEVNRELSRIQRRISKKQNSK